MFPKMGKTFPDDDEGKVDRLKYQMAIAAALKRELGGSHRAIKIVMRWTGVSERTAKNWLAGSLSRMSCRLFFCFSSFA
jgi:hypothetical protein